jgi:hypothetical protein
MPRWPDGSMVPDDPHTMMVQLEQANPGVKVWIGSFTGDIHVIADGVLLIAKSPALLMARLTPPRGYSDAF